MRNLFRKANNILLLSIKPQFVYKLLNGSKTTELRRVKPRVLEGDVVLIYETSPTMALVGYAIVESVTVECPDKLWKKIKTRSGITKSEFDQYYEGAEIGYAINFSDVNALVVPISLPSLRKKVKGFHPPQSYRYLCHNQASSICMAS